MRKLWAVLVCATILGATAVVASAQSGNQVARPAAACSAKGLSYQYSKGTAHFADFVSNLKATGVSCTTARKVAATAAKDILHDSKVAAHIGGLSMHAKKPCTGCSPVWSVTGSSSSGHISFKVNGG
jgi:hypothetical protein